MSTTSTTSITSTTTHAWRLLKGVNFSAYADVILDAKSKAEAAGEEAVIIAHVDIDDCLVGYAPFRGCESWYQCARRATKVKERTEGSVDDALCLNNLVEHKKKSVPYVQFYNDMLCEFRHWLGEPLREALGDRHSEVLFRELINIYPDLKQQHAHSERVRAPLEQSLIDLDAPRVLLELMRTPGVHVRINTSRGDDDVSVERTKKMLNKYGLGDLCITFKDGMRRVDKGNVVLSHAQDVLSKDKSVNHVIVALMDDRDDYLKQLEAAVVCHKLDAHVTGIGALPATNDTPMTDYLVSLGKLDMNGLVSHLKETYYE